MSGSVSDIRVFIEWYEGTVFAGEDVECRITFRNTAADYGVARPPQATPSSSSFAPGGERQRKNGALHAPAPNPKISTKPNAHNQQPRSSGHRPALSLNSPVGPSRGQAFGSWSASQNGAAGVGHKHKRSLSIVSMGINDESQSRLQGHGEPVTTQRPGRNHARAASLQIMPRWNGQIPGGPKSASGLNRATALSSPLAQASTPPNAPETQANYGLPLRASRRASGILTTPNTPGMTTFSRKSSGSFSTNFQFPVIASTPSIAQERANPVSHSQGSRNNSVSSRKHSPNPIEQGEKVAERLAPVTRVLSGSSMNGTPRSSADFYSMSNNSTETLASEYLPQTPGRLLSQQTHSRKPSQLTPEDNQRPPEIIMMGYAQITGSFTLDGSLVSQAPFEEVKRKGVVGGQGGGGVVGVETNKKDNGLFGSLGWGNIGDSLGGLLGGGELSSIKEMRGLASSKAIPLLSTPQSILFVDLRLAPGESKSYDFKYAMPRGLPPSYKGKAIKINYNLVIGTQRAGTTKEQQIRHVEVPFRLFGGVNGRGEILGHDLMSPYIVLKDQTRTSTVDRQLAVDGSNDRDHAKLHNSQNSASQEFLAYVDELLDKPSQNSNLGLLSPTATVPSRRRSGIIEEPSTAKEAIDLAILRSNMSTSSNRNANRFEIARSGRRVAVLMLARPAYRLGETISAVVDYKDADIPCYSIHATLETSEEVDPAIALRSSTGIYRASRRIHASHSENTLFARRVVFSPTIPVNATPEFITSGVSLNWKLRVEFVTPRLTGEEEGEGGGHGLLEEVARDERGTVLAAVEGLLCESFEVAVPIRVYGAVGGSSESYETEGLAV
ncbi:MAG: hypothetical protein M1836_004786 [Candelina mexicana]|nr:MAG: hypothetical protein M1836_004786 [Candelina mexicana]